MRVRTISRSRRRSLLRSTIDRLYFGTITPTRAQQPMPDVARVAVDSRADKPVAIEGAEGVDRGDTEQDDGEAATRTSNSPVFTRFPVRLTNSMSEARANFCARENPRFDVISLSSRLCRSAWRPAHSLLFPDRPANGLANSFAH